jgi:hypothetical protein
MKKLKTLIALSIAAAAVPTAFANSGSTFVGGEAGHATHPTRSSVSLTQLQAEYEAFRAHPVMADGTVFINGELGFMDATQGAFADRQPPVPHTHVLGNTGSSEPAALSNTQRLDQRQQYIN